MLRAVPVIFLVTFLAALVVGPVSTGQAGELDPNLEAVLSRTGDQEVISALVYLADRVDLEALTEQLEQRGRPTRQQRHEVVVTALQERAAATQGDLLAWLGAQRAQGAVADFQAFWIANCLRVDATPAVIREIAGRVDVETVYLNYPIELIEPVEMVTKPSQGRGGRTPTSCTDCHEVVPGPFEPGLTAIRAPEVWEMGFTGEGILVAHLDTGVDGNHIALASRWRGVADPRYADHPEWAWFDPVTYTTFPQDSNYHGTATMGLVCAGAPGLPVGVAPGAQWISAAVIDRVDIPTTVADAILAFQWMTDPDGDPSTNWDVPHACSNSWRVATWHGYPPCDETFWTYLDACEAAGTVILFSAGNEGPGANTIGRPPDRATDDYRTLAVGAIDANSESYPIAWFSSRGPSYCTPTGDPAIKPELVGPGVNVTTCWPGDAYNEWSGTSMASPHINGVVALILDACPDLSVDEVKQIMYDTALDLGPEGEDNDYGHGLVDAYEAVNLAIATCSPAPYAFDADYETPVDTPLLVTLEAIDFDGLPDPPGAVTCIITSLPEAGNTLTDAGNDHAIDAAELPYALVAGGNQVTYTPTGGYYGTDTIEFRGNDGGTPPDGGDGNIATISILVLFDPPVITTDALPNGSTDASYGPVTLEAAGGQPELVWDVHRTGEYVETDLGECLFAEVGEPQGWRQDNECWAYTLPFTFPFYGVEHNYIDGVCSNGFIDFYTDLHWWTNGDAHLITHTYIAPLWDDLRTDFNHDIYIDESVPGQVTIRWDAITRNGNYYVNVSVDLFEDGRIRFHYGFGNHGLTPTIGISAGDGENYVLSQYNHANVLMYANSLEFAPRPPQLPDGLEISPDGVLSGFPTQYGTFHPTFVVTDSLGRSDERAIELVITPGLGPPIAEDQQVSMLANTPTTVSLVAVDDGTPDPPGALTHIILSLPTHGTVRDSGGGVIDSVPYTLVDGGNDVVYTPHWWYFGDDSFTFQANDGGEPPDGGDSNVATVSIEVILPDPEVAYYFSLDADPGWTTEAQWAFGQPTGGGSHNADPTAGYTGNNVYGYNLNGDYTNDMPVYYLTTPPIDCNNLLETELRFWRWLGVESSAYDHAAVAVSADGGNWTEIWANPDHMTADSSWTQMVLDISALADGEPTVYVRWAMGPTDDFVTCPGWNIDDVEIWAVVTTPCCGDLDGDGDIDLSDLAQLLANYGMANGASYEHGDLDADGDVDLSDLAALLAVYGTTCQ